MNQVTYSLDIAETRILVIRRSFAFLEREYNFRCDQSTESRLNFEDGHTFIAFAHGPTGSPLRLAFGPLRAPGQPAAIFQMEDLTTFAPSGVQMPFQVRPLESLQDFAEMISALAGFVYHRAPGILRGEQEWFDRLAKQRGENARQAISAQTQEIGEKEGQNTGVALKVAKSTTTSGDEWALMDPEALRILKDAEESARRRLSIFVRSARREIWQRHTNAFKPRASDYSLAFSKQAAPKAASIYQALWQGELPLPAPWPGQTRMLVTACFSEWFSQNNDLLDQFPPAYREIAGLLEPGTIWVSWRYTKPDQEKGAAFDGLVQVGDRWVWFLRAHRVLSKIL